MPAGLLPKIRHTLCKKSSSNFSKIWRIIPQRVNEVRWRAISVTCAWRGGRKPKRRSDLCLAGEESLSGAEATLLFEILSVLIEDVELDLRTKLAERLAQREDVPRDLIAFLASDEIVVAYPVLTASELLSDEDLVRIVKVKAREHRLAVTERASLGPDVSDALVQTGDSSVIVSLLRNDNAEIYPETVENLVRDCRDTPAYREPLAHREDLEPEVAAKLYVWVGDALRNHIVERFELASDVIEGAMADVLSEAMMEFSHVADVKRGGKICPTRRKLAVRRSSC